MNSQSQETLRRVTQNDPLLTELTLDDYIDCDDDGEFYSENSDDYSTLGAAIASNTHLESLEVTLSDDLPLGVADRGFYDGLKSNSSINNLRLWCDGQNIAGGVGQEILKVYQEFNSQLTVLGIYDTDLQNGGDRVIADTLRCCRNLHKVTVNNCNIADAQLLPIVDAMRGHMLMDLNFVGNNIGNVGCGALATLLIDPNCNLHKLDLWGNNIADEGAIIIANSLVNNTKIQELDLYDNNIANAGCDAIASLLTDPNCNLRTLNLGRNAITTEGATTIANS